VQGTGPGYTSLLRTSLKDALESRSNYVALTLTRSPVSSFRTNWSGTNLITVSPRRTPSLFINDPGLRSYDRGRGAAVIAAIGS
jgi:hypothetical protein